MHPALLSTGVTPASDGADAHHQLVQTSPAGHWESDMHATLQTPLLQDPTAQSESDMHDPLEHAPKLVKPLAWNVAT